MPPSGPLSFAEKSEIHDEIELNYAWFEVTEVEKTWYNLHQPKFDIVTSADVAPPFCYPTPEECNDGGGLNTADAHNAAVGDFNGDGLQDLSITWVYFIHTTERNTTPSHGRV